MIIKLAYIIVHLKRKEEYKDSLFNMLKKYPEYMWLSLQYGAYNTCKYFRNYRPMQSAARIVVIGTTLTTMNSQNQWDLHRFGQALWVVRLART